MMQNLPKARNENIIVQEIGNEVMIYDTQINKAFCLNETCAVVFNHCDGRTTFDRLKREYLLSDEIIHFALDELRRIDLLKTDANAYFAGLSRRDVIKRVGLSSMVAIPLISSLAAPSAAQAASVLLRNGDFCSRSNQCQSSRCGTDGFGPSCCQSNDFGACATPTDCCSGVACTNNVCCQGVGRTCDTRVNICCSGLICVASGGTNGNCQRPAP